MSSRIFPVTNNPRNLEIIVGVPEGTHARLQQWEKDNPEPSMFDQEAGFARFNKLQEDKELADLDNFLTFGWGRVDHRLVGPDEYSGSVEKGKEDAFLRHHGIYLSPEQVLATEGLCWG